MKVTNRGILLITIFCSSLLTAFAQSTIASGGNEKKGDGGSVSFTVGQVFFISHSATTGEVFQGVQIAYEISIITSVDDAREINLVAKVLPNPATDYLTLSVDGIDLNDMVYYLFDITGKVIRHGDIKGIETLIFMSSLPSQIYFIKVMKSSRELKTFKIVKR